MGRTAGRHDKCQLSHSTLTLTCIASLVPRGRLPCDAGGGGASIYTTISGALADRGAGKVCSPGLLFSQVRDVGAIPESLTLVLRFGACMSKPAPCREQYVNRYWAGKFCLLLWALSLHAGDSEISGTRQLPG
jgi:hypothetical protein